MDFAKFAEEYSTPTKAAIQEIALARTTAIHKICQYHLSLIDADHQPSRQVNLGKLVRSALTLIGCWSVGGDLTSAIRWGAILEIIHSATLIHDDLEDADRERRGRLAVWVQYGEAAAILGGNTMMKVAHITMHSLRDADTVSRETYLQLQELLMEVQVQITEGQYLDLSFERSEAVTLPEYIRMVELKTSALLSFALYSGAIIGSEGALAPAVRRTIQSLGNTWGRLFQIQDDLIGIWGDERIGKPLYSDIVKNKKTLPLLYLTQNTDSSVCEQARQILRSDSEPAERIGAILELLSQTDTYDYCQTLLTEQLQLSLQYIDELDLDAERTELLRSVSHFLCQREV